MADMADTPERFEVHPSGAYFHGTKADLRIGDYLEPGHASNYRPGHVANRLPVRIVGEVTDWVGHSPEYLAAFRAGLDAIRRTGAAVLYD